MIRDTEQYRFEWNGILLELIYEPQWLGIDENLAHLSVTSIRPERTPLPITETGYRSHFVAAADVDSAGGPVAYVEAWLTAESRTLAWRAREQAARQFTLF
jgi:hypothetical protein